MIQAATRFTQAFAIPSWELSGTTALKSNVRVSLLHETGSTHEWMASVGGSLLVHEDTKVVGKKGTDSASQNIQDGSSSSYKHLSHALASILAHRLRW